MYLEPQGTTIPFDLAPIEWKLIFQWEVWCPLLSHVQANFLDLQVNFMPKLTRTVAKPLSVLVEATDTGYEQLDVGLLYNIKGYLPEERKLLLLSHTQSTLACKMLYHFCLEMGY